VIQSLEDGRLRNNIMALPSNQWYDLFYNKPNWTRDDVQSMINYAYMRGGGDYNKAAQSFIGGPPSFNYIVKLKSAYDKNPNLVIANPFYNPTKNPNYKPGSNLVIKDVELYTRNLKAPNVWENPKPINIPTPAPINIDIEPRQEKLATTPLPDIPSPLSLKLNTAFQDLQFPTASNTPNSSILGSMSTPPPVFNNNLSQGSATGAKVIGTSTAIGTGLKLLSILGPSIISGAISWLINKPSKKNAPDYSNINPNLSKSLFSFNSPNASAANDLYRTLYPSDVYSHMKTFDQFAKSSGDFGPTVIPESTKSQKAWKYIGQYGVPALTTLSGIWYPLNFLSGAFAGGTAYGVGYAAQHNPPDLPAERLFNPETLKPYADKGVAVMTTDYNGRPYLFLPELVYKDGKITPTGRFSRYISLYDKNSIQKIVGNNIQVARDDTKRKYIYYFTPTGNMSEGALPIAFVNTTPQIVNDIFNKIEGSSNNQLTTKIMDIMNYYQLGDVNEFIPEFHNLFEVNTPTITVPTKADSTSSNTGSGNTGSKGTSGKGTGSGGGNNNVSDSLNAKRAAILNNLDNIGK
jgi:hypothetical protein